MIDKPLDCVGFDLKPQTLGKHDFRHTTTATSICAPTVPLAPAVLDRAIEAMEALPPFEETIHHANVGLEFWIRLKARTSEAVAGTKASAALYGFPVYVDEDLPPDVCEFRNKDGKVLSTLRLEP